MNADQLDQIADEIAAEIAAEERRPKRALLSQSEARDYLGICNKLLLSEIRAGRLRHIVIGRRRKFTKADLDRYITERAIRWQSTKGPDRRSTGTISRSKVIGFAEALKRRPAKMPS